MNQKKKTNNKLMQNKGSFRDPSGFVYQNSGKIYRTISKDYLDHYQLFIKSGLKQELINKKFLINFKESSKKIDKKSIKTLEVEKIPFISYPYEWSFSQLKDAAFLTLKIQQISLKHGMILKDASVFNVQFLDGKPIFIDILSFEKIKPGKPWVAYKQFCQHFLAPLTLMAKTDIRLNKLTRLWIDGIPLDIATKLLPWKTKLNPSLFMHLYMHSAMQKKNASNTKAKETIKKINITNNSLRNIATSLVDTINKLSIPQTETEWGDYYNNTNYSDKAFEAKKKIVEDVAKKIKPDFVLDIGANTGEFSQIAAKHSQNVIAADIDELAVEKHYLQLKKEQKVDNVLPLIIDLFNPSPSIGWANEERENFSDRKKYDLVLALALIHHLAISNNLPLEIIAEYFAGITNNLLIEFIPKEDSMVQRLLATREDIFPNYSINVFEKCFSEHFKLMKKSTIISSNRLLLFYSKP